MDNITLINNFKEWARTATNLDSSHVINLKDRGPRPKEQYVGLQIMNVRKVSEYEMEYLPAPLNTVDIIQSGLYEIMLSIDVYRGNAIGTMVQLIASLDTVWANDFFNEKEIGVINQSAIRDLSMPIKGVYEERRQCDFFFYYIDKTSENVEAIEKIFGSGFGSDYEI